jgi:hypothetical protein
MHLDMVNQPENTMMVHMDVEAAMVKGQIAFAPVKKVDGGKITEFRVVVIDRSILDYESTDWKVSANSLVLGIISGPNVF